MILSACTGGKAYWTNAIIKGSLKDILWHTSSFLYHVVEPDVTCEWNSPSILILTSYSMAAIFSVDNLTAYKFH